MQLLLTYWKYLGKKNGVHNLQLQQVAFSCQKEHVTKVTKSLHILLCSSLEILVLTNSTFELLQIFLDANAIEKSIICQQKHFDFRLFHFTCLLRNGGETASCAVGQVQLCPLRSKWCGESRSICMVPISTSWATTRATSFSHSLLLQVEPWQQWLVNLYCHAYTSQAFLFKIT